MPILGPEGDAYQPHEAYRLVGRQLYGEEWINSYAGNEPLPDLAQAKRIAAGDSNRARLLAVMLKQGDHAYDAIQSRRHRESQAMKNLLNVLEWGKVRAWERVNEIWNEIDHRRWESEPTLRQSLFRDIAAYWNEAALPSGNLLIEKLGLDVRLPNIVPPLMPSPLARKQAKGVGRPGIDEESLLVELRFWVRTGLLQDPQFWRKTEKHPLNREAVCEDLREWYAANVRDRATPTTKAIKKAIKSELDGIEAKPHALN